VTARRDRGFATVWVVIGMAIVVFSASLAAWFGLADLARHRAAAAADAAAIRVGLDVLAGPEAACQDGARLAMANGGRLTNCRLTGADAVVTVAIRLPGWLAELGNATASARAGPASTAIGAREAD
jgi:secretion/DNA translocation related TadE-like protein